MLRFVALLLVFLGVAQAQAAGTLCYGHFTELVSNSHLQALSHEDPHTVGLFILGPDGKPIIKRTEAPAVSGYFIQRLLGSGSQGQVYSATALPPGTGSVAIKATKHAVREFNILQSIHKNRLEGERYVVHGLRVEGNNLVLELGDTMLSDYLKAGKGLPQARGEAMLKQLRQALNAVHAADFIHADVKPGNILVTASGEIRLADFGIATGTNTQHLSPGSPGFSSPNQRAGGKAVEEDDWYGYRETARLIRRTYHFAGGESAAEGESQKPSSTAIE